MRRSNRYISLTQMNMAPCILRTDKIKDMYPNDDMVGSTVEYAGGRIYKVRETCGRIERKMDDAVEVGYDQRRSNRKSM